MLYQSYCSFKVARLLVVLNFDIASLTAYNKNGENKELKYQYLSYSPGEPQINYGEFLFHNTEEDTITRPSHAEVIERLRLNKQVWIWVQIRGNSFSQRYVGMYCDNLNPNRTVEVGEYGSPEEAYDETIFHVLKQMLL